MKYDIFVINKKLPLNPNKHILPIFLENTEHISLTVLLTYSYSHSYHKFILKSRTTGPNRISLNDVIHGIDTYDHINLKHYSISYRTNNENLLSVSEEENVFLYVGTYPLVDNYSIEIPKDNILIINLRPFIDKTDQLRLELYEEKAEQQDENKKKHNFVNQKSKREKERKIGYILKKVYLWKKLYEGVVDRLGNKIKMTLQDAAEKVDISKKSLDEYLNQIRFGKLLGFDFNKHRNDKVGVLRGFLKTQMSNMEEKFNMNNLIKNKRKRAKQEKKEEVSNIEEINITIDETNQKFNPTINK